jgi:ABC-type transport system involved in cytochrome bd biosynthesis fused ATPase/permease subunit
LNSPDNLFSLLGQLFRQLSPRRLRQLALTAGLMLICSLAEMISLGAIIPFLAVLTEPSRIWDLGLVQNIAPLFGWQKPEDTIIPICLGFALVALLAGSIRISQLWVNFKLSNAIGSDLSTEVYRRTLYQPYSVHVARNTSEVITVVTNQVGAVTGLLQSLLQFATAFLVSLGLIITLV